VLSWKKVNAYNISSTPGSGTIINRGVLLGNIDIYPYDSPLSRPYILLTSNSAPPIHSQSFYFIFKSFHTNMSWPVKFNNSPDHGTEPQRGDDSTIAIATQYSPVITIAFPPGSPPSRIRVQHHNYIHYGPITVLTLSRCATPLNLS
jgi:hypothetical protein